MQTCRSGHKEIVYEIGSCPLCQAKEEISLLENRIGKLEEEIEMMDNEIVSLGEQLSEEQERRK